MKTSSSRLLARTRLSLLGGVMLLWQGCGNFEDISPESAPILLLGPVVMPIVLVATSPFDDMIAPEPGETRPAAGSKELNRQVGSTVTVTGNLVPHWKIAAAGGVNYHLRADKPIRWEPEIEQLVTRKVTVKAVLHRDTRPATYYRTDGGSIEYQHEFFYLEVDEIRPQLLQQARAHGSTAR